MSDKTLLVVEPGVKLNGDAYRKLEEAGFVIVRGDPSQFHVMNNAPDDTSEFIGVFRRAAFDMLWANNLVSRDEWTRECVNRVVKKSQKA